MKPTVRHSPASPGHMTREPGHIAFGTKAQTLARLSSRLKKGRILPLVTIEVDEWREDRESVCRRLAEAEWSSGEVIVRSSAIGEDAVESSQAGKFISILGVDGRSSSFADAVDKVIASFGRDGRSVLSGDQVLVQPMLADVVM